jgi:hypothetical protein
MTGGKGKGNPAGVAFQNGPYQAGHGEWERSLRLAGHSHAVQARLRKGTARFWAWSGPTGPARPAFIRFLIRARCPLRRASPDGPLACASKAGKAT